MFAARLGPLGHGPEFRGFLYPGKPVWLPLNEKTVGPFPPRVEFFLDRSTIHEHACFVSDSSQSRRFGRLLRFLWNYSEFMTGAFLWRAMHLSRLTQNSLLVARIRPSDD